MANEVRHFMEKEGLSTDAAVVKLGNYLREEGLSQGHSQRDQIYESLRFVKESGYWEQLERTQPQMEWSEWLKTLIKDEDSSLGSSEEESLSRDSALLSPDPPPEPRSIKQTNKRKRKSKNVARKKQKGKGP
jgi:hypothetical protein